MPAEIEPPEIRGKDKGGNVRPGDDRFLSAAQRKKRDRYADAVAEAQADEQAKAVEALDDGDPFGPVIAQGVRRALEADAKPEPEPTAPAEDPNQPALPTGDDDKETEK